MSVLNGGIFSRPRGKTGGIVFGSARTRQGKLVTSRLLVPPSNPNTVAQQTQRNKFAEAIAIVRLIGSGIYQTDWNRAIGQLPGFQSLTSVFLNSLDATFNVTTIPPINLGSLHVCDTFSVSGGIGTGNINVAHSTENGLNGTSADVVVILAIETAPGSTPLERIVVVDTSDTRTDATTVVGGFTGGANVSVLLYYQGVGTADGLLSPTVFGQANAGV
jgi:hypothetical protein